MIGAIVAGASPLAQAAAGTNGCSIAAGGARVTSVCTADNSLHIPVAYRSILPILILSVGALLVLLLVAAVLPKRSLARAVPMLTALIGVAWPLVAGRVAVVRRRAPSTPSSPSASRSSTTASACSS